MSPGSVFLKKKLKTGLICDGFEWAEQINILDNYTFMQLLMNLICSGSPG